MRREEDSLYRQELKKEGTRQKGLRFLLVLLLLLLFAVIAAAGVWIAKEKLSEKAYFEYMREADKYLAEMDYGSAELSYLKAVEKEPDREEAYFGLSALYVSQGRTADAEALLIRGIQATNSDGLFRTYEQIFTGQKSGLIQVLEEPAQEEDIAALSEDVTIDASLFDAAASYTYTDYVRHCGRLTERRDNERGGCDLSFEGFAGILSYYNVTDDHFIYDAQSGLPYATRKPNEIRFESLGDIFGNYRGAVSFGKLQEIFGEGVRIEEAEDGGWQAVISYHKCTLFIACDENGDLWGTPENRLIPPTGGSEETGEEEGSLVSGYVVNVLNGGGVTAKIRFLKGGRYGTVQEETTAGYDGSFEVRLSGGSYTAEISAPGFITVYEEIEVRDYADLTGLSFALSPGLADGEIRIVLTWGASPADLDSHLNGRSSDGKNISVSYMHMEASGVAKLDLDDRSGYGPETTTIYDGSGSYTFAVHDFTNRGSDTSTQLAASGAEVKIYLPDGSVVTYTVPSGTGTWWEVCRIENGQVIPVNTIR